MQHPQEQRRRRIDEQGGYIPQNGTSSTIQMPGMRPTQKVHKTLRVPYEVTVHTSTLPTQI